MPPIRLIFLALALVYKVHGLQVKQLDMDIILKYYDHSYKDLQQKHEHHPQEYILKDDNDDFTRLIQNVAKNIDNDHKKRTYFNKPQYSNTNGKEYFDRKNHLWKLSTNNKKLLPLNEKMHRDLYENIPASGSDYSKLYVILDPKVNLPKSAMKDISGVISSVLSKSDSYKKSSVKDHSKKIQYYKGFVIKDNRRRIKESKETFASKDSLEYDYKPKRGKSDYGGGGRTAIPYIRHRGDIYERV
ncbi:unnamed protein product, partial [Brenthis ino]